jgi:hypothetical protein
MIAQPAPTDFEALLSAQTADKLLAVAMPSGASIAAGWIRRTGKAWACLHGLTIAL